MGVQKWDRDDLVPKICERLKTGKEPLTAICADLGVPRRTVNSWREDPEIGEQIQEAKDIGWDAIAQEILDIADNTEEGVEIVMRGGKTETHTGDMLGHRKLKIETRFKLLARWDPKRYGDKVEVDHKGGITVNLDAVDAAL